jgi:hypothetical protein
MLKKRSSIIVITIVVVIFIAFLAINTGFAEDIWSYIGKQAASIRGQKSDVTIATVGNTRITQKDLDLAMLMREKTYELQSKEIKESILKDPSIKEELQNVMPEQPTKEKVLNSLIEKEILYQEAVKRNCDVSLNEAKKYLEDNKKTYDDILSGELTVVDKNAAVEAYTNMEDFAKGMGMSVEEYMEYLAPTVQKELSIAKLQQSILQSASIDIRNNPQKAEEYFNKQKEEIKKNYDVKYSEDAKKILEN